MFAGTIAQDASSLSDPVEVTLEAFDPDQSWGPAPWMPRVDAAGEPDLPNQGDRCIVALAETDDPGTPEVWIIAWWPYD